ncbi:Calcium-binding EF hand family protein [Cinnamomum micranthum f. kanehirae]|uniref:Calcium-binding EF hand family protein n=1 Tax=Cinnamomum micranthum f. kanehirae TaxID=337451 RepID=A0A3S3MQJ2_9MAGN|nr:Calcium-binding EF hand family protein [Cinnamomum micranthum f. kanehirae]
MIKSRVKKRISSIFQKLKGPLGTPPCGRTPIEIRDCELQKKSLWLQSRCRLQRNMLQQLHPIRATAILSRSELHRAFQSFHLLKTHFGVDVATPLPSKLTAREIRLQSQRHHRSPRVQVRHAHVMLAITNSLGSAPIQIAIKDDGHSFLQQAADLEAKKIETALASSAPPQK